MISRRAFLQKTAIAGAVGVMGGITFGASRKVSSKKISIEEAWRLHKKCLIIDGHTDTPVERMSGKHELPMQWIESNPAYQEDIPRMRENGQQYVGFMIISAGRGNSPQAFRNFEEMENQLKQHPQDLMKVLNSRDAVAAAKSNKIGIINAIEGGWDHWTGI
jgi:membrane dipeptidase